MWSHYNMISFLKNPHKRHPIAHPIRWAMGCPLNILSKIDHIMNTGAWWRQKFEDTLKSRKNSIFHPLQNEYMGCLIWLFQRKLIMLYIKELRKGIIQIKPYKLAKGTPCLVVTSEIPGVFCEYLGEIHDVITNRDHSGYGLSQWEKALHSNTSSHWQSPYPEWSPNKASQYNIFRQLSLTQNIYHTYSEYTHLPLV